MAHIMMSEQPAQTKAARGDGPPLPAVSGAQDRLTAMVKSATAELTKAFEERLAALEGQNTTLKADLEKALALPETGGPAVNRIPQMEKARETDVERRLREADELKVKADLATHPYLAQGYRARAEKLIAAAV